MASHRLYTIPFADSFMDSLASGILGRYGSSPLLLSSCTVMLPNRRSCRSLRDAFLRQSEGKPQVLPRIEPLGDIDEDEIELGHEENPSAGAIDLPPALTMLRRQLLLTRLVAQTKFTTSHAQAARLASELARLHDQLLDEGIPLERLDDVVPANHARHWHKTLDFLKTFAQAWPGIEAEEGAIGAAERRNLVLRNQCDLWRRRPPKDPVIAAGSTGSIRATAELLNVIATLPQGMVVLPGLDAGMDDESWSHLDEMHPQYGMSRLLQAMGVHRSAVRPWREHGGQSGAARSNLLAEVMRPASTTHAWRRISGGDPAALDGLTRIDCATQQDEAMVIALKIRHALLTPGRTVALVTPDRNLSRRVTAALERWGISVDDSAGRPLRTTPAGTYLRLAADCATSRAAIRSRSWPC
jgi:ATP-dependent helicase/nuclease subunit B